MKGDTCNNEEFDMIEENETFYQDQNDGSSRDYPGDVEIPTRIFVKGFGKETTDEELEDFFKIYGIVHDAKIVYDKEGVSKGYAFVTFDSQEIAEKVRKMGSILFKDRELVIGPAKIRKKRSHFGHNNFFDEGWPYHTQNVPYYISPDGAWYFYPFIPPAPAPYMIDQGVTYYTVPTVPTTCSLPLTCMDYMERESESAHVVPVSHEITAESPLVIEET